MPFGFPEGSPFEEFFERFGEQFGGHDRSPGAPPRATALGSGFIIHATGYVVTNNHVIAGAREVSVRLGDATVFPAQAAIGRATGRERAGQYVSISVGAVD